MGVRLYINSEDPRVLEIIAGVPKGTMKLLKNINKLYYKGLISSDEEFNQIASNNDIYKLNNLVLYGFGKFSLSLLIEAGLDPIIGNTKDFKLARDLFRTATNAFCYGYVPTIDMYIEKYGVCWN